MPKAPPTKKGIFLAAVTLLLVLASLSSCEESIPLEVRLVPSQLPAAEREKNRKLKFDSVQNFRELGGIKASTGQTLRWGMIYRASHLAKLTPTDVEFLARLHLRRIVDFRTLSETRDDGLDILPSGSDITLVQAPIGVAHIARLKEKIQSGNFHAADADQLLTSANQQFVEQFTPVYKDWVHSLTKAENYPMVFHCTTGKDRTGFATAILLSILQVPRARIMADYLATNAYTREWAQYRLKAMGRLSFMSDVDIRGVEVLLGVKSEYLQAAFDAISTRYGSMDNYLSQGLELTPGEVDQIRKILLRPVK